MKRFRLGAGEVLWVTVEGHKQRRETAKESIEAQLPGARVVVVPEGVEPLATQVEKEVEDCFPAEVAKILGECMFCFEAAFICDWASPEWPPYSRGRMRIDPDIVTLGAMAAAYRKLREAVGESQEVPEH